MKAQILTEDQIPEEPKQIQRLQTPEQRKQESLQTQQLILTGVILKARVR